MSLDFKLILDEFNRRFDELEIRWDRRFSSAAYIDLPPTSLSVDHSSSDAFASAPPTPVAVIADNWGGCFDDGEQYCAAPSVVADNWGRFFGGEDLASSDNPTRFVLPTASTDEPIIGTVPARANSGAADDSVFVTAEPAGYDESELHATAVLDMLSDVHTLGKARCASYADRLYASATCTTPDHATL